MLPSVANPSSTIIPDAGSVGSFEQRGGIAKEVVAEQAAGAEDELGIEVRTGQRLVHVAAVAAHLLGKPRHTAPLLAQRAEDHVAEMDVAHGQAVRFSCPADSPMPSCCFFANRWNTKKKRGNPVLAYPAIQALALPFVRR